MRSRLLSALNKFHKEERGFILPMVFILLLVAAILMPQITGMVGVGIVSGNMYDEKAQELYAADAGATDALWLLAQHTQEEMIALIHEMDDEDGLRYIYDLPEPIDNKTVHCEIMMADDEGYIIESTATGSDGSSTTVEVWCIHPEDHPNIKFSTGSLEGAIIISANLGTESEPVNIYADGDIKIQGSAQVYGEAYYTPGHIIDVDEPKAVFTGEGIPTRPLEMEDGYLPDITNEALWTVWNGNYTISSPVTLGWMHITGNLSFSGNQMLTLSGPVWVDGTISASASKITIQPLGGGIDNYPFLVSAYDNPDADGISIAGGTIQCVLYTVHSDIHLGGGAHLNGAAVGYGDITIMGSCDLKNAVPLKQVPISFYPMSVLMWKIY